MRPPITLVSLDQTVDTALARLHTAHCEAVEEQAARTAAAILEVRVVFVRLAQQIKCLRDAQQRADAAIQERKE